MTAGTLLAHQDDTAKLSGYADVSGVTLSGLLAIEGRQGAEASITVAGSRAQSGHLGLINGVLRGELGGQAESVRF